MIPDARPYLIAAQGSFTDPVEAEALEGFLDRNETISATLSMVAGKPVWLLAGPAAQIAIPVELLPELTDHAREAGTLAAFLEEFEATMKDAYEAVRSVLFPGGQ